MSRIRTFGRRYRVLGAALVASLALHAAVMKGVPARIESIEPADDMAYTATLEAPPAAALNAAPAPAPAVHAKPPQRRVARGAFVPQPLIEPEPLERLAANDEAIVPPLASTDAIEKA